MADALRAPLADDFRCAVYPAAAYLQAALSSVVELRDEPAGAHAWLVLDLVARWRTCAEVLADWEGLGLGLTDLLDRPEPTPSMLNLTADILGAFMALPPLPGTVLAEARRAVEEAGLVRPPNLGGE